MNEKKASETIDTSLSKRSNSNGMVDIEVLESNENINAEIKDFYTFDERVPKKLEWIWYPYIVKGNLNIIQGDGGLGKSYLITWLLSSISNGNKIPFCEDHFNIGKSILQNAEDDPDATVLPRLILNGADISKIGFFNEETKSFDIKQLNRLENKLSEIKPEVLVIDPITAYLGKLNMNSANEVREALKPLKNLAQKYKCAIIIIMHLNKNNGVRATQRNMGSTDFVASARSVIMITENPENSSERLFIPIKTNLMKENEKNTLSFKINDRGIIEWLENKGRINADELLNSFESQDNNQSVMKGFIIGILSRGDISAVDLKELSLEMGFSEKMFNITKAQLNKNNIINSYQKDRRYYWTLRRKENE